MFDIAVRVEEGRRSGRQFREYNGDNPFKVGWEWGLSVEGLTRKAAALALSRAVETGSQPSEFHEAWASAYLGEGSMKVTRQAAPDIRERDSQITQAPRPDAKQHLGHRLR